MANYHGCIIFATIIYLTHQVVDDVHAGIIVNGNYSPDNDLASGGNEQFERVPARYIRAPPFQLHEISTARGYGKRNIDYSLGSWESHLLDKMIGYQDNKRGSSHGIDLREPRLRFRMENDGGLRIGRGFGKRSTGYGQKEEYKMPWSSPTIRELNEIQSVLKAALEAVQDESTTVSNSENKV